MAISVADGGEGTVDSFVHSLSGEKKYLTVKGPFNNTVNSFYGIINKSTAIIEMAAAAGLPLVGDNKDAGNATTYGVGKLILDVAKK